MQTVKNPLKTIMNLNIYLFLLIGLLLTSDVFATRLFDRMDRDYQELRSLHHQGIGVGHSFAQLLGVALFYNRELNSNSQLHVQSSMGNAHAETRSGASTVDVGRQMLLSTYRRNYKYGLYYGAGGGYSDGSLNYKSSSRTLFIEDSVTSKSSFYHKTLFATAEAGWQWGVQQYYFSVAALWNFPLMVDQNFKRSKIEKGAGHRKKASDAFALLESTNQLLFGVGYRF